MRKWLKDIREEKKLTQHEVAMKSSISRSYYTHIESGEKTPTVKVAKSVADALDFDWIIFFEHECSHEEQEKQEAI